jgi:hypothetical protein
MATNPVCSSSHERSRCVEIVLLTARCLVRLLREMRSAVEIYDQTIEDCGRTPRSCSAIPASLPCWGQATGKGGSTFGGHAPSSFAKPSTNGHSIHLRNVPGQKNITKPSLIVVNHDTLRFVPWHLSGSGLRSGVGLTIPTTTQIFMSRAARSADLAQPDSEFSGRPVDLFRCWPPSGIDITTQISTDTATQSD